MPKNKIMKFAKFQTNAILIMKFDNFSTPWYTNCS